MLQPMKHKRAGLSLSGVSSQFIALGGLRFMQVLPICETYLVAANKWAPFPSLNEAWFLSGSVLLPGLRAFCFCGAATLQDRFNTVERIEVKCSNEWKTLPLNDNLAKTVLLACTQFQGELVLFGGTASVSYSTYILSEDEAEWFQMGQEILSFQEECCSGVLLLREVEYMQLGGTKYQTIGGGRWEYSMERNGLFYE